MNTNAITPEMLASSVIAVPPLARDSELKICATENAKVIRHLEVEGIGCGVVLRNLFPTIVDGGRIPAFELKQFRVRKGRVHWHVARINQLAADHNRFVRDVVRIYY